MLLPTFDLSKEEKDEFFALSTDDGYEARQEAAHKAWQNHMAILKMECPIANGSPKQIDWAVKIFASFTASADAEGFKHEDLILFFATYRAKHSKFWIDNRSQKNPMTGYSDRRLQKTIAAEIAELKRDQQLTLKNESKTEAEKRSLARRF